MGQGQLVLRQEDSLTVVNMVPGDELIVADKSCLKVSGSKNKSESAARYNKSPSVLSRPVCLLREQED